MFLTKSSTQPAFDPILVRDPVILRSATVADHEAWASLRQDSRDHLTAWEEDWQEIDLSLPAFKRRLRAYEKEMRRGTGLPLFIIRRDDRALVGGVTLSNIRYGSSRSGILGYWIGSPYVRQGYGAAAVKAVIDHAFTAIELNRIEAACQEENVASQNLLKRCGFHKEGLARDYLKINGTWRDHNIFAITASGFHHGAD